MYIKMYDVNFGEAIIYDNLNSKLLVDCGAKFSGKGELAYRAISGDFIFGRDDILITHFDEDHYNGLIAMAEDGRRIRRIFLPKYIVAGGGVRYTDNYFIDQLRSIMYLHVIGKKVRLNRLQKLFKSIIALATPDYDIESVAYGDIVNVGASRFDILWPEVASSIHFNVLSDEIRALCIEAMDDNNQNIEMIDGVIDNYINVFVAFYNAVNDIDAIQGEMQEQYEQLSNRFDFAHQRLEEAESQIQIMLTPMISRMVHSKISKLIKYQNDCSVVFSCGEKILALGDVSKKVVKYLKNEGRIANHYDYIKAPHHGTGRYYSVLLPDADAVFISNGGDWKVNWTISDKYPERYGDCVYCTNTNDKRCEWIKKGKPSCSNCNVFKRYATDPVNLIVYI